MVSNNLTGTQTGTVIRIISKHEYGFIHPHNGEPDIFFHRMGLIPPANFEDLREGNQVSYLVTQDSKGRSRAIGLVVD